MNFNILPLLSRTIKVFGLELPQIIFWGSSLILIAGAFVTFRILWQQVQIRTRIRDFLQVLKSIETPDSLNETGLPLDALDSLRYQANVLRGQPKMWWNGLNRNLHRYTSPNDKEGYFLVKPVREILSYDLVVGRQFNSALYNAIPGIFTASGLALTFVAILLALLNVKYIKENRTEPITGLAELINGLSGKFVSSIVALFTTIFFTILERFVVRCLRRDYERLIDHLEDVLPVLADSRILLDIQRYAAQQTVSVSNISSEVVDRFVGEFNRQVVPNLASGMSEGVAQQMQAEFRPTMDRMNQTLEDLKQTIQNLETQKQDSINEELKHFFQGFQVSLSDSLLNMGNSFHNALTSAASQEFGNVQSTLEATRLMLSEMNTQFGQMQASFADVASSAGSATAEQIRSAREQSEALTQLMGSLMQQLRQSSEDSLTAVRSQLTLVVADLSTKVNELTAGISETAHAINEETRATANDLMSESESWTNANAERLEQLLEKVESHSEAFDRAADALRSAQTTLTTFLAENQNALQSMAQASGNVRDYTASLLSHGNKLIESQSRTQDLTRSLSQITDNLGKALETSNVALTEYRRMLDDYHKLADSVDSNVARIHEVTNNGLQAYHSSIENNFKNLVTIANPMISDAAGLLNSNVEMIQEHLEELTEVLATATEKLNARPR
jgi:ABC-type transporter Mla subunit MlaD